MEYVINYGFSNPKNRVCSKIFKSKEKAKAELKRKLKKRSNKKYFFNPKIVQLKIRKYKIE